MSPPLPSSTPAHLTEHFFRHSYARMVAILTGYFGLPDVHIAEDIVQDTLVEATEKWSIQSIPDNPEGWLMDVAKKKAINHLKRDQHFRTKVLPTVQEEHNETSPSELLPEHDSMLKMLFTCCHPALPEASQIALALKTLCGMSVREIAHALLTKEATINKRLYRAKQKFRDSTIVFKVPPAHALEERLDRVYTTLYLLFNEGYYSAHPEKTIRMDFCYEAIRLLKQVLAFYPDAAPAQALLALMLLSVARFEARLDDDAGLLLLHKQDRTRWDTALIAEGITHLQASIADGTVHPYQLQAGIAAEHCIAPSFAETNWGSIYQQYRILSALQDSVIIDFNSCIAQFYSGQQQAALTRLLALSHHTRLHTSPHYHTTLGVFYGILHAPTKARAAFEKALANTSSEAEQTLIQQHLECTLHISL